MIDVNVFHSKKRAGKHLVCLRCQSAAGNCPRKEMAPKALVCVCIIKVVVCYYSIMWYIMYIHLLTVIVWFLNLAMCKIIPTVGKSDF